MGPLNTRSVLVGNQKPPRSTFLSLGFDRWFIRSQSITSKLNDGIAQKNNNQDRGHIALSLILHHVPLKPAKFNVQYRAQAPLNCHRILP